MTSDDFTPKEMIDWLRKEQDLRVCLSHDIRMCRVRPSPRELFAADQIEQLLARIAELEAALKPFADISYVLEETDSGTIYEWALDCDDLRAARAAYLGEKE